MISKKVKKSLKLPARLLILPLILFFTPVSSMSAETVAGSEVPEDAVNIAESTESGTVNYAAAGSAGPGATKRLSPMALAGIMAAVGVTVAAIAISLGDDDVSPSPTGPAHQ